jgi:hypothetical protein
MRLAMGRLVRGGAVAGALALASCGGAGDIDPSRLRIFFSTDAIGYLEPCG